MSRLKVKMIGAGGIGGYLVEPLARFLSFTEDQCELTVIDGDKYESRNQERQRFKEEENKAAHTVDMLKEEFDRFIHLRAKPEYITPDNVITFIREGDIVFLCVDNHATRKLVSDRCKELQNVVLISGGNEYTDGNVIFYLRKDGEDITRAPTDIFPEIDDPEDQNPGVASTDDASGCEAETQSTPQLLPTNFAIASIMLNVYYAHTQDKANFEQVYVDILTQCMRPSNTASTSVV